MEDITRKKEIELNKALDLAYGKRKKDEINATNYQDLRAAILKELSPKQLEEFLERRAKRIDKKPNQKTELSTSDKVRIYLYAEKDTLHSFFFCCFMVVSLGFCLISIHSSSGFLANIVQLSILSGIALFLILGLLYMYRQEETTKETYGDLCENFEELNQNV